MGWLSDAKDKLVDDLIPNELKSGAKAKESLRKLIPNELADVAVKAAPFVAMIPGQAGTAALMRGLGRFDQRGSVSDALKQGIGTLAFGSMAGPLTSKIPGIEGSYKGPSAVFDFGKNAFEAARTGAGNLKETVLEKTRKGDYLKKAKDFFKSDSDDEDGEDKSKGILDIGMDILTDPKKAIPLAMLSTYIKEKFFPGETQPSPYNVAMGKRGDDVASYLSLYGPYDPLRDPKKNPYSQAEKDKFVADNIVEYRNLPTYAGGGRVGLESGGLSLLGGATAPEEELKLEDIIISTGKSQGTPLIMKMGEKFNVMIPGQEEMLSFDNEEEAFDYMKKLMPFKNGGRVELNMGGGADDIFDQYEKKLLEQEGYDPGSPEKYGSDREMGIITLKDILDVLSKTMGYQDGGRVNFGLGSLAAKALTQSDVVRPLVGAGKNKTDDILDAITGKISFKGAGKAMPQPMSNTLSVEDILKISDEDDKDNLMVKLLSDVNFDRVNRSYGGRANFGLGSMVIDALTRSDVVRPLVGAGKNKADDILDAITGKISFKGAGKAMPQPMSNTLNVEDILKISDKDDKDDLMVKLLSDVNFDRVNRAYGSDDKVEKASMIEGLDINVNPKGIMELDMREEGGFIPPVGVKEKADDIPAMLSNNEFVFTADAVRAAGGGSVDKGAQRMYKMMKNLEAQA